MLAMQDWVTLMRAEGCEPGPASDAGTVDAAESAVGLRFPAELRLLYLAGDGVFDADGQWWVIWPLDMLVKENARRRCSGLLPGRLLAFGDDGAGNAFCVEPGQHGVSCWHPIDDREQMLAPDLPEFWRGWVQGSIRT